MSLKTEFKKSYKVSFSVAEKKFFLRTVSFTAVSYNNTSSSMLISLVSHSNIFNIAKEKGVVLQQQ
jgi:hypothetical protein